MNIQEESSAHYFRVQSEREQTLVSVLFRRPLTFFIVVVGIGGRGGIKMALVTHNKLMSPQGPHSSAQCTAKTNDKSTNLSKNGIYWYK